MPIALLLILALQAQPQPGASARPSCTVTVVDPQFQPLPGAWVVARATRTDPGPLGVQRQVTNPQGEAQFRNTPFSTYEISAGLQGFLETRVLGVVLAPQGSQRLLLVFNLDSSPPDAHMVTSPNDERVEGTRPK